jgi:hypothetical protein
MRQSPYRHSYTRAVVVGLVVLWAGTAEAQSPSSAPPTEVELDNLHTPTSPAFTLLGVSPTDIARPATPRALATELVSKTNRGSIIPSNYALEFAPYWLVSHPTLSYKEYTEPSSTQSIAQSFSISFATSRPDTTSDTASTGLAIGIRLLPLAGHASAKFRGLERTLDSIQRTRLKLVRDQADALDEIDAAEAEIRDLQANLAAATVAHDVGKIANIKQQIAATEQRIRNAKNTSSTVEATLKTQADTMRSIARAMGKADAERVGGFIELATAAAGAFPGGNFDGGKLSRFGAWGTFSYRVESPHLDVIGLLRFLRDLRKEDQNALEFGGRLLWLHEDLGVSAEWVSRTAYKVAAPNQVTGSERLLTFTSSSRAVGLVEYRAADAVYVTMSFGRDYKTLSAERHPLVAAFGVQFLYGDKPVVKLP